MSWTKCHRKGRFFVLNDPNKSKNPTSEVPWFWPRFGNPLLVSESQSSPFCRTFRDAFRVLLWVPGSPDSAEVAEELPAESVVQRKETGRHFGASKNRAVHQYLAVFWWGKGWDHSILYNLWTRFWLFKKGLKQTLRHMWYLSLSLQRHLNRWDWPRVRGEHRSNPTNGAAKSVKKSLPSQLYRQAAIKERISKNTAATLTYADINYWMVSVWPSDFLACSWKPRSSTHVSQHWGH